MNDTTAMSDHAAKLVHALCALAGGHANLSADMATALETRSKAWAAWNEAEDALEAALARARLDKPPVPKAMVVANSEALRWMAPSLLIEELDKNGQTFHWAPVAACRWAIKRIHPAFQDMTDVYQRLALAEEYAELLRANQQRHGIEKRRAMCESALDRLTDTEDHIRKLPAISQADNAAQLALSLADAINPERIASL
jgi:hypothetical protein